MTLRQPHRLTWPLSPAQVESLDEMLYELYKRTGSTQGIQGLSGTPGVPAPGLDGTDGEDGLPGIRGPQGTVGPLGLTMPGMDGEDGIDGFPGVQGLQGIQGIPGGSGSGATIPGPPGMDGEDGDTIFIPGPGGLQGITQSTALTGTQNDLALVAGATLLQCNNASLLTITGFSAGVDGQQLTVVALGAGLVSFAHQNAGSVAAGRLINKVTSANVSLSGSTGVMRYQYDGVTARWRCLSHHQGAPITPTFSAANFEGESVGLVWTVDAGDIYNFTYVVKDTAITIVCAFNTTTLSGTPGFVVRFVIPDGFAMAAGLQQYQIAASIFDNAAPWVAGILNASATVSTTKVRIFKNDQSILTNSTNNWYVQGVITFELT